MMTVVKVIFFSHMISCMWWGLSTTISSQGWLDNTLMVYDSLRNAPFQQQYIASLYWTVTTLTTTGYGDITPVNNAEYVSFLWLLLLIDLFIDCITNLPHSLPLLTTPPSPQVRVEHLYHGDGSHGVRLRGG